MYKPRGEQPFREYDLRLKRERRLRLRLRMTVIKHSFGTHPSATPPPSLQREGKKKYVFASMPSSITCLQGLFNEGIHKVFGDRCGGFFARLHGKYNGRRARNRVAAGKHTLFSRNAVFVGNNPLSFIRFKPVGRH